MTRIPLAAAPKLVQSAAAVVALAILIRIILALRFSLVQYDLGSEPSASLGQLVFSLTAQVVIVTAITVALIFLVRGARSARIWVLVLSVIGIAGPAPQGYLIPMVLGIVGACLCFLPRARRFFRETD
jgi:uncharacterized paraquat-inducible protein A